MKHFKTYLAAMALALSGCQSATDSCGTTELWYAQPAKVWMYGAQNETYIED